MEISKRCTAKECTAPIRKQVDVFPTGIRNIRKRQVKLADRIVQSIATKDSKSISALKKEVGYAEKTTSAEVPSETKKELTKFGFTESAAKRVVAEILSSPDAKDADRLAAADKVFKVFGTYAPEKQVNLNVQVNKNEDPELRKLREEYENKLRESLT